MKSLYRQSLEKRDATKGAQMKSRWIHLVQLLEELQCLQQDILPKESEFT